jgi:transcriptional regulator with PAS, ATPase and Fis domain
MPLSMQGEARVIQEKTINRVGSNRPLRLDLRFIAATNKDLKKAVAQGRFREDLYFRLNVVQINLPGLMERPEDIPLLMQYFLERFSQRFAKKISGLDQAAGGAVPPIRQHRELQTL